MALAALIAACAQVEDGGEGLRATLPLVGATLLEHQARLARRAGAAHVVVVVERLPATLTTALDRLRRDGIVVEVARSAADAADRIHPDEKVLVIADGCLAGQPLLDRLVAASVPAVVTVPDHSDRQMFERIDAVTRWGGLALIDGVRLRHTVAMLGDWDMLSTLLRRTLQEGPTRIDAFPQESAGPSELLVIADRAAALQGVERRLIGASRARADDWPGRYLFPPIEDLALRPLAGSGIEPTWLAVAAVPVAGAAIVAALLGWRWPALALLLLSGPMLAVAARIAGTRVAGIRHRGRIVAARDAAAAIALVALAHDVAASLGWGVTVLAGGAVAAALALAIERRSLARLSAAGGPAWLASADGMIWALPPFAAASAWGSGIAALALYALVSFFYVQRRLAARAARPV